MRFSLTHTTVYRYTAPVFLEPHVIRLRPRDDAAQRLLSYDLVLDPQPAGQVSLCDYNGNTVVQAWFDELLDRLTVRSRFEAETLRENPFDFLLPPSSELALPFRYPGPAAAMLAPYANASNVAETVREYAHSAAGDAGMQAIPFLAELNWRISQSLRVIHREHGPPLAPAETLRLGEGSCRDLAVLFCEACRSMGLATRFVSGYDRAAAEQEPAFMHAWSEVYVPGGGWRGYDASRGVAVTASHVAVAAAFDAELAAPISGAYRGAARASMDVSIQMQIDRQPAAVRA